MFAASRYVLPNKPTIVIEISNHFPKPLTTAYTAYIFRLEKQVATISKSVIELPTLLTLYAMCVFNVARSCAHYSVLLKCM